jgi:hypothetical protein
MEPLYMQNIPGQAPARCWREVVARMREKPYITDRDPGDERDEPKEETSSCE